MLRLSFRIVLILLLPLAAIARAKNLSCLDSYRDAKPLVFRYGSANDIPILNPLLKGITQFFAPLGQGTEIELILRPDLALHQSTTVSRSSTIYLGTANFEIEKAGPVLVHEVIHRFIDRELRITFGGERMTIPEIRDHISRSQMKLSNLAWLAAVEKAAAPYSELIADFGAVLYYRDLSAMANALGFRATPPYFSEFLDSPSATTPVYRSQNKDGPRPRDFGAETRFRGWKDETALYGDVSKYTMFDPLRGLLGRWVRNGRIRMSKTNMAETNAAEIINAVIDAAGLCIERFVTADRSKGELTVEDQNHYFREALLAKLHDHGLWAAHRTRQLGTAASDVQSPSDRSAQAGLNSPE